MWGRPLPSNGIQSQYLAAGRWALRRASCQELCRSLVSESHSLVLALPRASRVILLKESSRFGPLQVQALLACRLCCSWGYSMCSCGPRLLNMLLRCSQKSWKVRQVLRYQFIVLTISVPGHTGCHAAKNDHACLIHFLSISNLVAYRVICIMFLGILLLSWRSFSFF